jgi:hypothetical protein
VAVVVIRGAMGNHADGQSCDALLFAIKSIAE